MIEPVTMYKTGDGQIHSSMDKAEEHVVDRACELLDASTKELLGGKFTRADQTRIILHVFDNYANTMDFAKHLGKITGLY